MDVMFIQMTGSVCANLYEKNTQQLRQGGVTNKQTDVHDAGDRLGWIYT